MPEICRLFRIFGGARHALERTITMADWKDHLGDASFYRKILAIALPISAQQLITVGVNLMDTVMLSSMGDAPSSPLPPWAASSSTCFRSSAWAWAWAPRCSPRATGA